MKANIIIDGNNYPYNFNGRRTLEMDLDLPVTLQKCKEIIETVQSFGYAMPQKLDIRFPEKLGTQVYYFVNSNCIQIWENNMPIYENINGNICEDLDALADSLM